MLTLRFERDPDRLEREHTRAEPSLLFPLDSTVLTVAAGTFTRRLDRGAFAVMPARTPWSLEVHSAVAPTLVLGVQPRARDAARREYAPHFTAELWDRIVEQPRAFSRTRWVDELANRYLFERQVCARHDSAAARFLETELTKELFFLGKEQLQRTRRASQIEQPTALLERARRFIDGHLFEPLTLSQLARECHTSASTLLRAFRRELGVGPAAYLRWRRLDEALLLLESHQYSVSEVAARVGYAHLPAFTTAFTKRFGAPPSGVKARRDGAAVLPPHGTAGHPAPVTSLRKKMTISRKRPRHTARRMPRR